ncbi:MAG TPA: TPM domain-containing protein [Hyphomicrobium sp.]|nr:TPM domain-containing protein [Hyphomicrobium sp.]
MRDALVDVADLQSGKSGRSSKIYMLLAVAFAVVAMCAIAVAAPVYPELTGRIVDNANLINAADRAQIEAELKALEGTSTDQVAVVTVPSLEGYAIEDYSIGLARKWAIGQKDKDNGIVLIVAPNERKVRIEVGRRLEPLMTDTMASLIVQNAILTQFRRGDFSGGIRDGVRDIKAVLLGDAEEVKQRAIVKRTPQDEWAPYIHLLVFALIIAIIFYQMRQAAIAQREWEQNLTPAQRQQYEKDRQRARNRSIVILPGGSGDWGGGWSGGSGGGGGWSGGGGDFGGGGASGGW